MIERPKKLAWQHHAACRLPDFVETQAQHQAWHEYWMPPENSPHHRYKIARSFCDVCPVKEECLRYCLEGNIRTGMWGGVSPPQRRVLEEAVEPGEWSEYVGAQPWLSDLLDDQPDRPVADED